MSLIRVLFNFAHMRILGYRLGYFFFANILPDMLSYRAKQGILKMLFEIIIFFKGST
jgi:hypothetical protein